MPRYMDDNERLAWQLESLQQARFRVCQNPMTFYDDETEAQIFEQIQTEREQSQTYLPDAPR